MANWRNVLAHLVLWILLVVLVLIIGTSYVGFTFAIQKIFSFLCLAVALFYFNYYLLIPRYFHKKHYFTYSLLSLLLILTISTVRYFLDAVLVTEQNPFLIEPDKWLIFLRNCFGSFSVFGLALVLRVTADWRAEKEKILAWKALKNETDLKFLKNQLRPHFLFNSINNIYSIAVENDDKSAPLLLEISQMLRYLIYKTDQHIIPLKDEVHFLNALIRLYSLGFDTSPFTEISIRGPINKHEIPPFLLLTFIENVFKHGDFTQPDKEWLLTLYVDEEVLRFETKNPIRKNDNNKDSKSGIGLSNLKKRLDILFPNAYTLENLATDDSYHVRLALNLNEK